MDIQEVRESKGLTRETLAKLIAAQLHISPLHAEQLIKRWERGKVPSVTLRSEVQKVLLNGGRETYFPRVIKMMHVPKYLKK